MIALLWFACVGFAPPEPATFAVCAEEATELEAGDARIQATLRALPRILSMAEVSLPTESLPARWTALGLSASLVEDEPAYAVGNTEEGCWSGVRIPVEVEIGLGDGTVLSLATGIAEADEAGVAWMRVGGDVEYDTEGASEAVSELATTTLQGLRPELAEGTSVRGAWLVLDGQTGTFRLAAQLHDFAERRGWYRGLLLDTTVESTHD